MHPLCQLARLASPPRLKVKQYPVQHLLSRGRAFTPSECVKTEKETDISQIFKNRRGGDVKNNQIDLKHKMYSCIIKYALKRTKPDPPVSERHVLSEHEAVICYLALLQIIKVCLLKGNTYSLTEVLLWFYENCFAIKYIIQGSSCSRLVRMKI